MHKSNFRVYYQNVRGLNTKISDFYCECLSEEFSVIVLTETWLYPEVNSSELFDNRYVVYRCDRNMFNSSKMRGGGVLIAVLKTFLSSEILLNVNTVEQLFVKITVGSVDIIIGTVYLPPDSGIGKYVVHTETVNDICEKNVSSYIFLVGDYNLPNIVWHPDDEFNGYVPFSSAGLCECHICDSFSACGLHQLNCFKNIAGNVLDLCFTNLDDCNLSLCNSLSIIDASHPPLLIEVVLDCFIDMNCNKV